MTQLQQELLDDPARRPLKMSRPLCFPGGSVVKNLPDSVEMQEAQVWSLGREDCLEEEMATRWYSCWENCMDRGAWWATAHGFAKSQTWLRTRECVQWTTTVLADQTRLKFWSSSLGWFWGICFAHCILSVCVSSPVQLFATPCTVAC